MTSPRNLTANGLVDPIGVDERPLLAWDPAGPVDHEAFQLEVHDTAGSTLWRASVGSEAPPELRYDGPPLRGRTSYRWRVRTIEGSGSTSGWSGAQFETGILDAADWSAQWIGRPTPAAQRPLRSPAPDDIQWIRAGETLEQTFTTSGLTTAVSLDLTSPYGEDVIARAELLAGDRVVAAQDLQGGVFPWDRFAHYIEAPEPLSPGTYRVVISVTVGSVGWRTARAAPPADARMDDGLSPLPVVGHALRDGVVTEETRSLAVEPVPAPNPVFRHRGLTEICVLRSCCNGYKALRTKR
ncbi:MAG: hypothetical protein HGA44_16255 [Cellulomonadaceae bacterium]|nr:hypothetical protein [Cellulomonadaceae bacterium]